jgi:hypothetical protein
MGIYNTFAYGDGTTYGQSSSIQLSVEPFNAVVLGSQTIRIDWIVPSGEYTSIRLIRNQEGISEHHEDGQVLFTDPDTSTRNFFVDNGDLSNLVEGNHVYYSIWVMLLDFSWMRIGVAETLLPKKYPETSPDGTVLRSGENRFANLLPSMFITSNGNTDVVDETSDLYAFLSSMSLIVDEMFTNIENLTQRITGEESTFSQAAIEAQNYGISVTPNIGMITLKRLVRQAISSYLNKGTEEGLRTFCSALTRYGVDIIKSPNLLFSVQDSTFYLEPGDWISTEYDSEVDAWTPTTDATIIAENTAGNAAPVSSTWTIDTEWYGKVVTTAANAAISLGGINPTTFAIPVSPGNTYRLSFSAMLPTGTGTVTAQLTWFDRLGRVIDAPVTSSTTSLTSTWQDISGTDIVAPDATFNEDGTTATQEAKFVGVSLKFSAAGTYRVDMVQLVNIVEPLADVYTEARAVEVYLHPDKTNFLYNPSFETLNDDDEIDGWTFAAPTTQVEASIDGIYHVDYVAEIDTDTVAATTSSAPLVSTTTTHALPIGKFYTFSMYVRTTAGSTGTMNLGVILSDTLLDVELDVVSTPFVATTEWQRISVRAFIPVEFVGVDIDEVVSFATCILYGDSDDAVIQIDSAQLEDSYLPTDYFDGNLDAIGGFFSGDDPDTEESEDISYLYYNASSKIPTLATQIKRYLPRNMAYTITLGDVNQRTLHSYGITD